MVPGVPTGVHSVSATTSEMTVAYTPPADNGGTNIAQYSVQVRALAIDGSFPLLGTASFAASPCETYSCNSTAHFRGLQQNYGYYFSVAAINSVGIGGYSAIPVNPFDTRNGMTAYHIVLHGLNVLLVHRG